VFFFSWQQKLSTEKFILDLRTPATGVQVWVKLLVLHYRFASFDKSEARDRSFEISSFTENAASRLFLTCPIDFVRYNRRQTSRIYPKGARMDSSNYMPFIYWNAGCQFVALNFQMLGTSNLYDDVRLVVERLKVVPCTNLLSYYCRCCRLRECCLSRKNRLVMISIEENTFLVAISLPLRFALPEKCCC